MKDTKNNKNKIKEKSKSKKKIRGGMLAEPSEHSIYNPDFIVNNSDYFDPEIVERLRSYKPNIEKLRKLNQYLSNLRSKTSCNISEEESCTTFSSGASGQIVKKCGESIYKGPNKNLISNIETSQNGYSYLLDPNTMNILVQSVIKYLIENKLIYDVEHYEMICSGNIDKGITVPYYLKGKSYEYCFKEDVESDDSDGESVITTLTDDEEELRGGTGKKCYNSLESYLIENKEIDVRLVADLLQHIFDILDKLFNEIQFHHCDPKAAQIFLSTNEENEVVPILGDLDKVTFSLGIENIPFRMRLGTSSLYSLGAHRPEFTNYSTAMRYQNYALENNTYEKLAFLYSSCLLCNNIKDAKELKKIVLEKNPTFEKDFTLKEITENIWEEKEKPQVKGLKNKISGMFYKPTGQPQKKSLSYPLKFITVKKDIRYLPLDSQVNINKELKLEMVKGGGSKKSKKTKNKKERRKKKYTKKKK